MRPWRFVAWFGTVSLLADFVYEGTRSITGLAFGGDVRCGRSGTVGVQIAPSAYDGSQCAVEVVAQRCPGGKVQVFDLLLGEPVQDRDQGAQRVAVGDHQHPAPGAQLPSENIRPVRGGPGDHVRQALQGRQPAAAQGGVAGIRAQTGECVGGQRAGRDGERAAPRPVPFGAGLAGYLAFDAAGEGTVLTLVEPPGAVDRDPRPVQLLKEDVRGADRPPQHGGVHGVGYQPVPGQQLRRRYGLLLPVGR